MPMTRSWVGWSPRRISQFWVGWLLTGYPVLGGLPLTSDDFRTHRAPIPSPSATIRPRRPRATFPQAPYTTYAINARDDAPRPTRRTRSQTAILDGNAPSRSDYRTVAHSGFAASAAAASPPLRTSPPPRSARLGSTTSPGRRAPISSTSTNVKTPSATPLADTSAGMPQHHMTSPCDLIPSHRRPASTDILDLAAKAACSRVTTVLHYSSANPSQ